MSEKEVMVVVLDPCSLHSVYQRPAVTTKGGEQGENQSD